MTPLLYRDPLERFDPQALLCTDLTLEPLAIVRYFVQRWQVEVTFEEARRHLRQAVRLDPDYSDAHYNLAFVCEKLSAFAEAREHWQAYVKLEPVGPWCSYARQRLASQAAKSAGSI